jgi:pyridoxal phosphate enzyme (YggS family)
VPAAVTPEVVAANLAAITGRIERAGGDPAAIEILAVSKTFGSEAVTAAYEVGLRRFGENYAAELVAKAASLELEGLRWHYLGAIQRNKLSKLAPVTSCFETLTRLAEAEELARRAPGCSVLVQLDTTGLAQRNGLPAAEVPTLVAAARGLGLAVEGLMTIAPREPDAARAGFRSLTRLADELGLAVRSMGMTDDLELAVAEGSTEVRIGRALFGARAPRA